MIAAAALASARGFVSRIPAWFWLVLAALALIIFANRTGYRNGVADEAVRTAAVRAKDKAAVAKAEREATAAQAALIARSRASQAAINERTDHAYTDVRGDNDRANADLFGLWEARRAAQSRAAENAPVAIPVAAPVDNYAACAISGGIPFGDAKTIIVDASADSAKVTALQDWIRDQAAAWPKDEAEAPVE